MATEHAATGGTGEADDVEKPGWPSFAQAAIGAVSATSVVYLVGGIVMWGRFRKEGIPADEAVAVMSSQELLVVGLRLMVLPAVLTGVFAFVLRAFYKDLWTLSATLEPARWLIRGGALFLFFLGLMLLPAAGSAVAWAVATALVFGAVAFVPQRTRPRRGWPKGVPWFRLRTAADRTADWRPVLAFVALSAVLVSFARQFDQPVQLLATAVELDQPIEVQDRHRADVQGIFVSSNPTTLFVGVADAIVAIPRSDIRAVTLGPPHAHPPSASIASRLLGGGRYSITPLAWWCDGERYGWNQLGRLCRTQPQLVDATGAESEQAAAVRVDGDYVAIRVVCPRLANDDCRGFVHIASVERFPRGVDHPYERVEYSAPLRPASQVLKPSGKITRDRAAWVCVPMNRPDRRARGYLRRNGQSTTSAFVVTITSDPDGDDILRKGRMTIELPPKQAHILTTDGLCSDFARVPVTRGDLDTLSASVAKQIDRLGLGTYATGDHTFHATHAGTLTVKVTAGGTTVATGTLSVTKPGKRKVRWSITRAGHTFVAQDRTTVVKVRASFTSSDGKTVEGAAHSGTASPST